MAVIRNVSSVFPVPHEPGQEVTLRKLNHMQLSEARKPAEREHRERTRELGGEFFAALRSGNKDETDRAKDALESMRWDPAQFDRATLFRLAVEGWTYSEACTDENLAALDEQTAEWLAKTIIEFSKPPSKDDRKN